MANILLVAALFVLAAEAVPLSKTSSEASLEKSSLSSRREIAAKITDLLRALRQHESNDRTSIQDSEQTKQRLPSKGTESRTESRRRLIEHIRNDGGLRTLIRSQLEKIEQNTNKQREAYTSDSKASDAGPRRCRPGIFYCPQSDEGIKREQSGNAPEIEFLKDIVKAQKQELEIKREANQEVKEEAARREMAKKQADPAAQKPKRRCRPGLWYCPQRDSKSSVDDTRLRSLDHSQTAGQLKRLTKTPLTKLDDDADWLYKLLESTER